MARVVVTGGAGFIGSHVVRQLLSESHEVVVIDDFSSGKRENLPESDKLEVVEGSILDEVKLRDAFKGCAAVIHLAAIPSVQLSIDHPERTHEVNYRGTMTVARVATEAGITRIVYASSAAVYGDAGNEPVSEASPTKPLSPYGVDKLAGEYLLQCWAHLHDISCVALRFFNVYGERQDPSSAYSGVISIFADRILTERQMAVFGDGHQTRDFVYVGDVAQVVCTVATMADLESGFHLLNVATGTSSSLLDLINGLEQVAGKAAQVEFREPRAGDILHSAAQVDRLRFVVGNSPATKLERGLARLLSSL